MKRQLCNSASYPVKGEQTFGGRKQLQTKYSAHIPVKTSQFPEGYKLYCTHANCETIH